MNIVLEDAVEWWEGDPVVKYGEIYIRGSILLMIRLSAPL